jgi:PASTA domain
VGLFVQVESIPTEDDARKWLDKVVEDHEQKDSPSYVDTLTVQFIAHRHSDGRIRLIKDKLDWIKNYLHHFDYLFFDCCVPPEELTASPNMKDPDFRQRHLRLCRVVAQQLIDYLRAENITIPAIHWYIQWEEDLNHLTSRSLKNAWKAYLLQFTNDLTEISLNNGLNEPEFFWSPFFGKRYRSLEETIEIPLLIANIRDILQSVPKLGWLHFQDGVGRESKKNSDGTFTYGFTAEDAINFYHNILVRASGGNLRSGLINMEFFLCAQRGCKEISTGDPFEHEDRMGKYELANIPVGISFEVRYWYESKYFRIVPDVIGLDTNLAVNTVHSKGFTTVELFGSNLDTKISKQEPPGGTYVHKATSVKLTAEGIVIVPHVLGEDLFSAISSIKNVGLAPKASGDGPMVTSQNPSPGARVLPGSTVNFHLRHTGGQPP